MQNEYGKPPLMRRRSIWTSVFSNAHDVGAAFAETVVNLQKKLSH